jgi:hypothetical protein
MKRNRLLILSLVVAIIVFCAPVVFASTVSFGFESSYGMNYFDGFSRTESAYGGEFGFIGEPAYWLTYTPTTAGLFSQQKVFHTSIDVSYISRFPYLYSDYPGPPYTILIMSMFSPFITSTNYYVELDQSGPLRFTDITWEVKMINNGSETTVFKMLADSNLITNGGIKGGMGEGINFGDIIFPVVLTYYESGVDPSSHPFSGWYAYGTSSIEFTFIIYQTGHVVPLPPTVLLLGSGLLGLAGVGRKLRAS